MNNNSIFTTTDCETACPFYLFYRDALEAVFITRRDGIIISANASMERLLGYDKGELTGKNALVIYESEHDRKNYQDHIEQNGFVHNYQINLKKKDGSPIVTLIDAIVWKEDGKMIGYHGIIKTRNEIIDSFQKYFLKVREQERKLREERQNFVNDSMMIMRYMSDDIIRYVQKTGENPLESAKRKATILFFDIRQSTAIAEQLSSDVFASLMSDIFTDIMDLIYGNEGSVNKMLGDGLMATFGCPVESEDASFKAVLAAVQIQNYLHTFNDVRPDYLAEPIAAGIGIATGTVFSGVIGSVRMQEYTVLGDAVNTASRLESLTKETGHSIIVDSNTFNEVSNLFEWNKISGITLRGKKEAIETYGLY